MDILQENVQLGLCFSPGCIVKASIGALNRSYLRGIHVCFPSLNRVQDSGCVCVASVVGALS